MPETGLKTLMLTWALFGLGGCGGESPDDHHGHHHDHNHVHTAMHGGTLVELGDHSHNLEFVLDKDSGTLGIYTFGGHAETFVRIKQPSITLSLNDALGGADHLELAAVANEVTGESVGDTAYFSIQNDNLKGAASLSGKVNSVEIQGQVYSDVPFALNGHHGHTH